jgi:hypothetical protein
MDLVEFEYDRKSKDMVTIPNGLYNLTFYPYKSVDSAVWSDENEQFGNYLWDVIYSNRGNSNMI